MHQPDDLGPVARALARALDWLEDLDECPDTAARRVAWLLLLPLLIALPFLRPLLDVLDEWMASQPKGRARRWLQLRRPSARFMRRLAVLLSLTTAVWCVVVLRWLGVMTY
ncbi:hypothetical protein [Stenotrophomonas maltophilia]|uniref:hypothetical protein n=1 Tax=Stenotrophomonas maltophilia TaxID=40324 RepID=UPI0015DFEF53|nr:hypothetical protein [Stenotrophomonas maltophilia]MBA0355521.1 hypothetical protein [Stenotrophomonas maltophilia]